ncbi:hypothetical protein EDD16DRAFT_1520801 [Pisolithus croceorrhizus]|nr:hypothetical protein EDD16DRAFT_1520801 [Pisolithus croceorrhizus]KAI6154435.1 hypothetical protein EDD17DRAFT_1512856 [Pisolithus thermaeus]
MSASRGCHPKFGRKPTKIVIEISLGLQHGGAVHNCGHPATATGVLPSSWINLDWLTTKPKRGAIIRPSLSSTKDRQNLERSDEWCKLQLDCDVQLGISTMGCPPSFLQFFVQTQTEWKFILCAMVLTPKPYYRYMDLQKWGMIPSILCQVRRMCATHEHWPPDYNLQISNWHGDRKLHSHLEKPSHLPGDTHTDHEMYFLPWAPSQLTLEQECNPSAVHPQHPTNSFMHSSPPCPAAPIPIPLVGSNRTSAFTDSLTPKSKNHLTDPMTGKIILSAVSEAYNRMLDTLGELI